MGTLIGFQKYRGDRGYEIMDEGRSWSVHLSSITGAKLWKGRPDVSVADMSRGATDYLAARTAETGDPYYYDIARPAVLSLLHTYHDEIAAL